MVPNHPEVGQAPDLGHHHPVQGHLNLGRGQEVLHLLNQTLQKNLKNWGIYNLNSVIVDRVLRFLEYQNRFQ